MLEHANCCGEHFALVVHASLAYGFKRKGFFQRIDFLHLPAWCLRLCLQDEKGRVSALPVFRRRIHHCCMRVLLRLVFRRLLRSRQFLQSQLLEGL